MEWLLASGDWLLATQYNLCSARLSASLFHNMLEASSASGDSGNASVMNNRNSPHNLFSVASPLPDKTTDFGS